MATTTTQPNNNPINPQSTKPIDNNETKDKVQISIIISENQTATLTIPIDENVDAFCDNFCKMNNLILILTTR